MTRTVQSRLSEDILTGRLSPGTKLKLADAAAAYGSGMSPLREALSTLAGQGLVLQEGQKGFRVAPVSLADLRDVIELRARLETMAFRDAIALGDALWEANIVASLHVLTKNPRTADVLIDELWEKYHSALHMNLLAACGSPRLLALCETLMKQFDRYRRLSVLARKSHAELQMLEPTIVSAALERNATLACDLLEQHIRDSGNHVIEQFIEADFSQN